MSINDGSSTRFCGCGFVFHSCHTHRTVVTGRGPSQAMCSCTKDLICSCKSLLVVVQPGVLFCQPCQRHYIWDKKRGLYVAYN
jgi:hypothetical protein